MEKNKKNLIALLLLLLLIFLVFTGIIMHPAVLIILSIMYGGYLGKRKAKMKFLREIKKINLENPYIYFREIPNNYGIGVSGLLLDFNLSKNDLIAAILDLCAKKHIRIEERNSCFEVFNLNKDTTNLLSNEIFILNWILCEENHELEKFDYKKWKSLVKQDALNIGIIKPRTNLSYTTIEEAKKNKKFWLITSILYICINALSIFYLVNNENAIFETLYNIGGKSAIIMFWILFEIVMFIMCIISVLPMFSMIRLINSAFRSSKERAYNKEIVNIPEITSSGAEEIQQLYALGNFIKDFGRFSEKHISEIVIWEQYFSYAQLFGLTKNLLSSNCKQLTENECFKIKDISQVKKIVLKQN